MALDVFVVEAVKNKMRYVAERHAVLASNVANSSTPGAKAKDLEEFEDFISGKLQVTLTHPGHMTRSRAFDSRRVVMSQDGIEEKLNGNNISLSNEMMKLNRNSIEYKKLIEVYAKLLGIFRIAIGR